MSQVLVLFVRLRCNYWKKKFDQKNIRKRSLGTEFYKKKNHSVSVISRIKRHANLEISSSPICLILKNTQATIRSCRLSLTRSPICVDLSMRLRNLLFFIFDSNNDGMCSGQGSCSCGKCYCDDTKVQSWFVLGCRKRISSIDRDSLIHFVDCYWLLLNCGECIF